MGIPLTVKFTDAAYRGELGDWLYLAHQRDLEIAPTLKAAGVEVVPLQWIVGSTSSRVGGFRRLTRDSERYPNTARLWCTSLLIA